MFMFAKKLKQQLHVHHTTMIQLLQQCKYITCHIQNHILKIFLLLLLLLLRLVTVVFV